MFYRTDYSSPKIFLLFCVISMMSIRFMSHTEVAAQQGPSPQKVLNRMDSDNDGLTADIAPNFAATR